MRSLEEEEGRALLVVVRLASVLSSKDAWVWKEAGKSSTCPSGTSFCKVMRVGVQQGKEVEWAGHQGRHPAIHVCVCVHVGGGECALL